MSKLWKKATFPTIEDLAKEIGIKRNLTVELSNSVRNVLSEQVGKDDVIQSGDSIASLCTSLEAIFIHGLKGKFSARMASVFGNNAKENIPEPDFWSFVLLCSHKNVINYINTMKQITTDVGRCRAWLRISINDGLICSYLDTIVSEKTLLQNFYTSVAYLRDLEQPDIMKQILTSISVFAFKLPCNSSPLNIWNSTPLVLAGIWTPPSVPQPVMQATDVIEYFIDHEKSDSDENSEKKIDSDEYAKTYAGFQVVQPVVPKLEKQIHVEETDTSATTDTTTDIKIPVCKIKELNIQGKSTMDGDTMINSNEAVGHDTSDPLPIEKMSGNRLLEECGWSSEFECIPSMKAEDIADDESYDSILQSYNKNRVLVGTPDLSEMIFRNAPVTEEKDVVESVSVESKSSISDYDVIPRSFLLFSSTADERLKQLLSLIGNIAQEKGLDSQDYKCRGCGCPIGMLYGKAYICMYDGYSYCSGCHANDESYIPARIIHNWDFKKYPVAKYTKTFLTEVENEPLLELKAMNPLIYTAVEEMVEMKALRTQLTFLRSYIFTCKESIVDELRKKIWPREYLYEHVHLYSLGDLIQCSTKTLQQTLQKVINFAKKHVLNCQLCSLKAFICEICNNSKVIYPFEMETTYHCNKCLAVYHRTCIEVKKLCPKCERKRVREERSQSFE